MASQTKLAGAGGGFGGISTWSTPSNITSDSDGNACAQYTASSIGDTPKFDAWDFGFTIPSDVLSIDGIEFTVRRRTSVAGSFSDQLVFAKDNRGLSTNSVGSSDWATSFEEKVYGSSTELWGQSWSYSNINHADFGIRLFNVSNAYCLAEIEYISATVYYTPFSDGTTVTATAALTVSNVLLSASAQAYIPGFAGGTGGQVTSQHRPTIRDVLLGNVPGGGAGGATGGAGAQNPSKAGSGGQGGGKMLLMANSIVILGGAITAKGGNGGDGE